jgi:hypothetical protein
MIKDSLYVDSAREVTGGTGDANPYEAEHFTSSNAAMMYYELYLDPNPKSLSKLSNASNEMSLSTHLISNSQARDLAENGGNNAANRWARIISGKLVNPVACNVNQITVSDIHQSMTYAWNLDETNTLVPAFPWWGGTITNPYSDTADPNFLKDKHIIFSVYIFDLLGNMVASPNHNACLQKIYTIDELFKVDNGTGYNKTQSVNFGWLNARANPSGSGGSPCQVVPAWNALNNKGRLVAPGGYIVKLVINNGVDAPDVSTLKLIMTNKKRGVN